MFLDDVHVYSMQIDIVVEYIVIGNRVGIRKILIICSQSRYSFGKLRRHGQQNQIPINAQTDWDIGKLLMQAFDKFVMWMQSQLKESHAEINVSERVLLLKRLISWSL